VNKSLHSVIPTEAYLSTRGRRLDPLLRRYLDSLLTAPFTFFEVLACDPGSGMTLRDVMTQEEHAVAERSASRGVQPGDLLFGQLASVDRLTMLEAGNGFAISPMEKAPIIELRAHIASAHPVITHQVLRDRDFELLDLFHEIADRAFNPRLPTLQNIDGEPSVACAAGLFSTAAELTHRGNPAEDQEGRHVKDSDRGRRADFGCRRNTGNPRFWLVPTRARR
jgi:hypothetical protein